MEMRSFELTDNVYGVSMRRLRTYLEQQYPMFGKKSNE